MLETVSRDLLRRTRFFSLVKMKLYSIIPFFSFLLNFIRGHADDYTGDMVRKRRETNGNGMHQSAAKSVEDYQKMVKLCGEFDNTIVNNYEYVDKVLGQYQLDYAQSQTEAYIIALQHRLLVRDEKYIDIATFPDKFDLAFPPALPIICYHTYTAANNRNTLYFGNLTQVLDKKILDLEDLKQDVGESSDSYKRLSAYSVNREPVIASLEKLVGMLKDTARKQPFQDSCTYLLNSAQHKVPVNLGSNAADSLTWLAVNYNRRFFNHMAKVFIADSVMYEIVKQGCKALDIKLQEHFPIQWSTAAPLLRQVDTLLKTSWHEQQLKTDVESLLKENQFEGNAQVGIHNEQVNSFLTRKYYWMAFRTILFPGRTTGSVSDFCKSAPGTKCIDRNNILVVVRWKELYEAVDVDTEKKNTDLVLVPGTKMTRKTYSDSYAKAEKVITSITSGIDTITAPMKKFIIPKSFVTIGKNGKAVLETAQAAIKVGKVFQKVLKAVTSIAKYLGPLASGICAVLSMFEEDGTTAILDKLDKGFNEMHGRFDRIEQQLSNLRSYIEQKIERETALWNMYDSYKMRVSYPLDDLREAFKHHETMSVQAFVFKHKKSHESTKMRVRRMCNNERTNPIRIIHKMHKELVTSDPFALGNLIVPWARDDRFKLQTFLLSRANELGELISFNTKCALYRYSKFSYEAIEAEMGMSMQYVSEIKNVIIKLDNDQLYTWQSSLVDDLANKAQPKSIAEAQAWAAEFETKYNWNNFSVLAFNPTYPNQRVSPANENLLVTQFLVNPDYSTYRFISGDNGGTFVIVNWGLKTDESQQGPVDFSVGADPMCNLGSAEYTYKVFGNNIKSMFTFRTYTGKGDHTGQHGNTGHPASRPDIGRASETCCNFGGSLRIGVSARGCWYKIKDWTWSVGHDDYKAEIYVVANMAEGY